MLTQEHQDKIAAAIPAGVKVPLDFWRDLDTAVVVFSAQHEGRLNKPPWRERKRCQRIEKLVDALAQELRDARLYVSGDHSDPLWPNRALRALWAVKYRAESNRIANEILSHGYSARRQPHRELFYRTILDLWQTHLGQEIRVSRSKANTPSGPLLRFFAACIGPVLGDDAPTLEGLAKIVMRERMRRRKFAFYAPHVTIGSAPKQQHGTLKTKK